MANDWVSTADPATPALIDRDTVVTYGELDRLVDATARSLLDVHRVEQGDLVAVVAEPTVPGIAMLWALWRLGAVVVPLPSAASALPEGARLVSGVAIQSLGTPIPEVVTTPDAAHSVVPTSGSTGHRRSVILTHGNIGAAVAASQRRLGNASGERWLLLLPLHHVGGLSILWRSAAAAGTVVLAGGVDPRSAVAAMSNVHWASVVPTMLVRLLEFVHASDVHELRGVLVGGGYASVAVLERALDAGLPVLATYGMTETCSQVATMTPGQQRSELGTVGHPVDGYAVSLSADGEILVAGPAVSPGYLGDESRSGPLKTGDLGRFDDAGRLVITGRRKTLIISGGENVDPERVESIIASHPSVDDVAVFGVADQEWGERVVAAIVWATEPDASLVEAVTKELERWEVPKEWRSVDAIARTSSGKIDRSQLS